MRAGETQAICLRDVIIAEKNMYTFNAIQVVFHHLACCSLGTFSPIKYLIGKSPNCVIGTWLTLVSLHAVGCNYREGSMGIVSIRWENRRGK
jgi:hypothetical protein